MTKNTLTELIRSLSKEEIRNFKLYINRINSSGNEKKLLQLFELIRKDKCGEYGEEVIQKLQCNGKNTYYRIKNRLIQEIEFSLLLLNRARNDWFKVNNYISLASIFRSKSDYDLAHHYLLKAEKKAEKFNFPDLLNIIYEQLVELSQNYRPIAPTPFIEKLNQNLDRYKDLQAANSVIARIIYDLNQSNFAGKDIRVLDRLNEVIEDLEFVQPYRDSPAIQLQIHTCVKGMLLQTKEFTALEEYLISSLWDFENRKFFNRNNHQDKLVLLSWIINTLTKNMKFAEALEYASLLHDNLLAYHKLHYDKYIWVYYQSLIINYSFLNKPDEVIDILEGLKEQPPSSNIPFYSLFIYLNLATTWYCKGNVDKASHNLSQIISTNIYKDLPPNWKLVVLIVEIMLRLDAGDYDYVIYRLQTIRRTFRYILDKEGYAREKELLSLFSNIAKVPGAFKNQRIRRKLEAFIQGSPPFEPGSNEAISYQVWLESKLQGKKYYDLVLEKVK